MTPSKILAPAAALGLALTPVAAQAEGDIIRAAAPVESAENLVGGTNDVLIAFGVFAALAIITIIATNGSDEDMPASP